MALTRWNPMMPWRPSQDPGSPFTGIESLRSEMERLFDTFSGTLAPAGTHEAQPFQHGHLCARSLAVEMCLPF
jgi:hypothetical protein